VIRPGDEVVIYPRPRLVRHFEIYGNRGIALRVLPSGNIEVECPPCKAGHGKHRVWLRRRDVRKLAPLEQLADIAQ
jgi:hypothetical protein